MGMRVKLYIPLSLVLVVNTVPRSTSRATTSAPLMGAPPASTTVPVIAAVTFWPKANCAPPTSASEIIRHKLILKKPCMATTSSDLLATEPHFRRTQVLIRPVERGPVSSRQLGGKAI